MEEGECSVLSLQFGNLDGLRSEGAIMSVEWKDLFNLFSQFFNPPTYFKCP